MKQGDREAEVLEARNKLRKEENEVEGGRQSSGSSKPIRQQSKPSPQETQGRESSAAREIT